MHAHAVAQNRALDVRAVRHVHIGHQHAIDDLHTVRSVLHFEFGTVCEVKRHCACNTVCITVDGTNPARQRHGTCYHRTNSEFIGNTHPLMSSVAEPFGLSPPAHFGVVAKDNAGLDGAALASTSKLLRTLHLILEPLEKLSGSSLPTSTAP